MKMHKYEVFILDFEDYGSEEYKTVMEQHRHLSGSHVIYSGTVDIGEWDVDIDFNDYNKYFK